MAKRIIVGIHITNRTGSVPDVQRVLTEFGCVIRTRLGLHQVADHECSPSGLLILETHGDEAMISEMETQLSALDGVEVKEMVFAE